MTATFLDCYNAQQKIDEFYEIVEIQIDDFAELMHNKINDFA